MDEPRKLAPPEWAGYVAHRKSKLTGTTVVLVEAEAQGLSVEDGGRWALICNEHGGLIQDTNKARLRGHMGEPEQWCPDCQEKFRDA